MGSSASTIDDTKRNLHKLVESYQVHGASDKLLPALSLAMTGLAVPLSSRSYRRDFSENYIMLLGQGDGIYRPEILSAAIRQESLVLVNGQAHQLRPATLGKGMVLKNCFQELCEILSESSKRNRFPLVRLRAAMAAFESIWVQYEEVYISELIHIENLGKRPLAEAISSEFQLLDLEFSREPAAQIEVQPTPRGSDTSSSLSSEHSLPKSPPSSSSDCDLPSPPTPPAPPRTLPPAELRCLAESACRGARNTVRRVALERLVLQVPALNGCANGCSKGRGDLGIQVLEAAADLFLSEDIQQPTDNNKVRETLANAVLEGFLKLRQYLHKASRKMLYIDPQLSNNSDLARSLVAWEEAWELGNDFLVQPDLREAFCGISVEAAAIQEFKPQFAKLVEDQDAELFLILPRLVLLSGLWESSHCALARNFGMEGWQWEALSEEFLKLCLIFPGNQLEFWKLLVAKALHGPGDCDDQEFSRSLEKFLLQLEGLSMQLQRSEPQRWNRCCQLLLRSIGAALAAPVRVLSL